MNLEPIHLIAQMIHERSQLRHRPRRWHSLSSEDQKYFLMLAQREFHIFLQGEEEAEFQAKIYNSMLHNENNWKENLRKAGEAGIKVDEVLGNYIKNTNR